MSQVNSNLIKTNSFTGKTTASSISVTAEGGSTTTNLQQGLCKCWLKMNAGQSITDSLNVSTLSDYGTGDYAKAFTSVMGNADYALVGSTIKGAGSPSSSNYGIVTMGEGPATNLCGIGTLANSGPAANDRTMIFSSIHGDLA